MIGDISKSLDKEYLEKQFENYNKKLQEDVIANLVPDKRTVAGLNLKQDIMISELVKAISSTLAKDAAFSDLFAKITESGNAIELSMDPNSYVITSKLKNKGGSVISTDSIDLPLESVVVNLDYNKIEGTIRLVLQNGLKTDPIRVSDITSGLVTETTFNQTVNNLVPNTRTIAGVDLKDNVTATELKKALGIDNVTDSNVSNMVPNTRTIAGIDLVDNITTAELKTALAINNVNNTSDSTKNVLSATKLTTARNINGVAFDGTKDITIADSTKVPTSRTIAGVDLVDNITASELKTALALNNVNNTADANKNVASAAKLTTAIKINGVAFDGTKDINLPIPEAVSFVGGRNLTLNGAAKIGYMSWGTSEQKISHWTVTDYGKDKLNSVGTKFVLSFDASCDVNNRPIGINIRNVQNDSIDCSDMTYFNLTTSYKRYHVYGEIKAKGLGKIWVVIPTYSQDSTVFIENVKLELGEVATDFTEAPEDMESKGDKIEYIGGRNLILKGDRELTAPVYNDSVTSLNYDFTNYGAEVINKVGKKLVVSFEAKTQRLNSRIYMKIQDTSYNTLTDNSGDGIPVSITTEYKRYNVVIEILRVGTTTPFRLYLETPITSDNVGSIYIKNVKVEIGEIGSDYTPSPEDVENLIKTTVAQML